MKALLEEREKRWSYSADAYWTNEGIITLVDERGAQPSIIAHEMMHHILFSLGEKEAALELDSFSYNDLPSVWVGTRDDLPLTPRFERWIEEGDD